MNWQELKHIVCLLLLGCCFLSLMAVAVHQKDLQEELVLQPITKVAYQKALREGNEWPLILQQFSLRPIERRTKKRKKRAKKRQKKQNSDYGERSQLTAFLLCVLLGIFGVHRFYTGQIGWGILHLCSLGCCGVFVIIDMVLIIVGKIKTKDGDDLIPW